MNQGYLELEDATDKNQIKRHEPAPKAKSRQSALRFEGLRSINFWFFLKESIFFVINYVNYRLVTFTLHLLYGHFGLVQLIGRVAYSYNTMHLMSSNVRNFCKPLSLICGPLYSKGDYFAYRVQRNKLFMLNVLCYLLFACLLFALEPFYELMRVNQYNLPDIVLVSKYYILVFAPLMSLAKFLEGGEWLARLIPRPHGGPAVSGVVPAAERGELLPGRDCGAALHCEVRSGHPRVHGRL